MPCYDPRDNAPDIWEPQPCLPSKAGRMDHNLSEYGVEVVDADVPGTLMGLLCEACTLLEADCYFDNPESSPVSDDLYDWWMGHRERDAERLKVVKEKALAKLTLKEKIALGLVEA